jgi:diguanylate cyclase
MKTSFVLVIDDETNVTKTVRFLLQREGFEVCVAENADRGLELAFDTQPDLILCDVSMPGLSGLEMLRVLKGNPRTAHIPVVLMSGWEQFDCAGIFTFLKKPFDATSLLGAARNALAADEPPELSVA